MLSPAKLKQRSSAPEIRATSHSRSGSDSTLIDFPPPSPTTPSTPNLDFRISKGTTRLQKAEASQDSRASTPSKQSDYDSDDPCPISDAWQDELEGIVQEIKAILDTDSAERLARAVSEVKAAKDEEWTDRLEKTVAEVEAAKDEELEMLDRCKESNHSNAIKDLEEDHEYAIKELEETHAATLEELSTNHDAEIAELVRKHGVEARKLEMRRAHGVQQVSRVKESLVELEAEKVKLEKDLVHMTGQRDALFNTFAAMKG